MRLDTLHREVSSSGVMQVARATIKATPKIFDMFANDTYANKPLAILRELVANGVDAHVAAGRRDTPVEVVLPTPLDPTCRVRDFGTGMSHDFVMGPFMAYTNGSTKDKNDDAIGGFGIGSKSPFSYVDQYNLRVVHDGILSVYTMFKDADGIPAIGLQGQTTTTEPNGVEISFPVEEADMDTFRQAAQDALQYFRPLPVTLNGTITPPQYLYQRNDWAMRDKAGPLGVIMGGVRYPVTTSSLDYSLRTDERLKPLLEYGLDLFVPIGTCGVAMSREQLSYVPKTSAGIRAALDGAIDDVVARFSTFFDSQPSEWDAMASLFNETGADTYGRSSRAALLLNNAVYKGKKLETSFRVDDAPVSAWLIEPRQSRRGRGAMPSKPDWRGIADMYGITPGRIETLIIDDLPRTPKSKTAAKLREYLEDAPQAKSTLIVRGQDEKQVERILKLLRNPSNYVLTSSLPEPAVAPKAAKAARPRVRMFTFNGSHDKFTRTRINNLRPAMGKADAVKEVPYADQPASGIVVGMNMFDLPAGFHDKMDTGLVRFDELHFVNETDLPKVKDFYRNFNDVFAERLKARVAALPNLKHQLALYNDPLITTWGKQMQQLRPHLVKAKLTQAAKERPFMRLFELWNAYVRPMTDDERKLAPFVTPIMPNGIDTKLLDTQLNKQKDLIILLNALTLTSDDHAQLLIKHL
jgi:hypothetical protein